MLNKYNDLINMLIARGYNVSEFEELGEEYSAIIDNNTNIYANIYLENTYDDSCSIDELVITNGGIFAIKTLNYPYDDYTEFTI